MEAKRFLRLNVGGKVFHTSAETIGREPDWRLTRAVSRMRPRSVLQEIDGGSAVITFDADPEIFEWVLKRLRSGLSLPYPMNGEPPSSAQVLYLHTQLDYWGLPWFTNSLRRDTMISAEKYKALTSAVCDHLSSANGNKMHFSFLDNAIDQSILTEACEGVLGEKMAEEDVCFPDDLARWWFKETKESRTIGLVNWMWFLHGDGDNIGAFLRLRGRCRPGCEDLISVRAVMRIGGEGGCSQKNREEGWKNFSEAENRARPLSDLRRSFGRIRDAFAHRARASECKNLFETVCALRKAWPDPLFREQLEMRMSSRGLHLETKKKNTGARAFALAEGAEFAFGLRMNRYRNGTEVSLRARAM